MRYFHRTIHYHYYTPRERKIYSQMCLNNAIQFGLIPGVKSELPGVVHIDENDRHQCNEFWHERGMLNIGNSVGVRDAERIKKYYLRYKDEWTDEEKEKFLKVLSNFVYSVDELENIENISFRQKRNVVKSEKKQKYDVDEELRKIDEEFRKIDKNVVELESSKTRVIVYNNIVKNTKSLF